MSIKEETIKNYFEGTSSIASLMGELNESIQMSGNEMTINIENDKSKSEFRVKKEHLIKLCHECLNEQIQLSDLTKFAFILRSSDFFIWDNSQNDGSIINDLITNWESPKINGELTKEYIQYCAYFLETGEHR